MRRRADRTTVVTTAGRSHSDDIDLRQRRYVRSQLVRVACVALGVLLPVAVAAKVALFGLALALPWFGVVMANAGPVASSRRRLQPPRGPVAPPAPVAPAIESIRVIDDDGSKV